MPFFLQKENDMKKGFLVVTGVLISSCTAYPPGTMLAPAPSAFYATNTYYSANYPAYYKYDYNFPNGYGYPYDYYYYPYHYGSTYYYPFYKEFYPTYSKGCYNDSNASMHTHYDNNQMVASPALTPLHQISGD